ncbi:MAG: insulinase family protein [Acidimicrobiales bacterium]|nr:insulinase family protein [Acidimicrobiales bacterium]
MGDREGTLRSSTLDGGLTVVTERMSDVRSVSIGFWVGTGSVDEADAQAGSSHFLEHLLFKGTARLTAREIALAVDSVGGDMNAFTTKEYTTFYLRLLAEDAGMGADLLSDIIWAPAFRPDEFESERQVILEEILMHADEPADLVHDVLAGALFPGHPLGREVLGFADTVSALTVDDVARFHGRHYQPGNIVVAAAGLVDHDRLVETIAARMDGRSGGRGPERESPKDQTGGRIDIDRDTEQAHIALAVPGPDRDDEDRHALSIVEHVLGGGMSSRLFQAIREERGLAYAVYAYRLGFEGAGALAVYAGTSPDHAAEVLELIEAEVESVANDGITEAEMEAARGHVRGALALGLEDSGARMSRIGHAQLVHGRVLPLDEVYQRVAGLTLDDVNDVARRWLSGPRTVATVGPGGLRSAPRHSPAVTGLGS